MRFDTADLAQFQHDFLQSVIAPQAPTDSAVLRVHRDTFFHGLLGSLCEVYEVTSRALGDESFRAFARDYIRAYPLRSGNRNDYGKDFGDFLTVHPALPLPWLPDLARYEFSLHLAHHAMDASPCTFEALLTPDARIALHPSAQILSLLHEVKAFHAGGDTVRAVNCDLLIGRNPDDDVVSLCLAPIEVDFIALMTLSGSLFTTLEQLTPTPDDMTVLQSLLARLVQQGLIITSEETP